MAGRRAIQGVLHNFLGTYTSRNSDLHGYWLFGFLSASLDEWCFDLLGGERDASLPTPESAAERLARARFHEQMAKGGVRPSDVQSAHVRIRRGAEPQRAMVDEQEREGREMRFEARAVTRHGSVCSETRSVFVGPHDPRLERRSARADDATKETSVLERLARWWARRRRAD